MPTTAYAITVTPPSVGGYAAPVAVRFEDAAAPGASPFANRPSLTLNGSLIGDSDETLISDVTTFYFVAATAVNLHAKVNGDDVDHRLGLVPLAYASPLAIALQPSSSGADLPDLASQYPRVIAVQPSGDTTGAADTTAIQAALDSARTAGGGHVYLAAGTFYVNIGAHPVTAGYACALTIGSNTTFRGAGRGATVVKLVAAQTRGNDVSGNNAMVLNRTLTGGDVSIEVQDVTFDGNAVNQTHTHAGINMLRVRSVNLTRVRVKNCRGTALSAPNETFMVDFALSTDVVHTDCDCLTDDGGSTATGFSANSSSNVEWKGCIAYGMSVAHGFTHNTCRNLRYVNCHSFLNATYGFNSESSIDVLFSNCIAGGKSTLAATHAYASGTTLGNTDRGFTINGTTQVVIAGCLSRWNARGIDFTNSSSGHVIGGAYTDNTAYGISFGDTASATAVRISGAPLSANNPTKNVAVPGGIAGFAPPCNVTAPSIPATTVALTNPYPFAATVYLTGGTVSAVAVAGTATGLTAGTFRVPANATITLTYTVAPTWTWFLE